MDAIGAGRIVCEVSIDGKWLPRHLEYVLQVPSSRRYLFSQSSVLDKGMQLSSSDRECEFTKNGEAIVRGIRSERLFTMLLWVVKQSELCESNVAEPQSLQMWHERLGHQNKQHMKKFLKERSVTVLDDYAFCAACVQGK